MEESVKILIVEDDMIIAANISLQLTKLGYEVTGIESRGEAAISNVKGNPPNILLLDINLKGALNGIETAKAIQISHDLPIIYLTANSDEATFEKARETHPMAFITKPFNKLSLQRSIALVVEQLKKKKENHSLKTNLEVLNDRIFVRHKGKMEKLLFDDILFVEADRNYCTIVSEKGRYVLSCTLKAMEVKLPRLSFVRVHRSFIVNIGKLDVVADSHLEIKRKVIPMSKSQKEFLMNRLQTI